MIKFALKSQIPYLKEIWRECFDDSEEGINYYFDNKFTEENALIWEENNIPVSMLMLLPAVVYYKSKRYDIKYIYAVSTLKKYRNKGFSSKLLEYANTMYETVLVPAEEKLFNFYKNKGYDLGFYVKRAEFDIEDIENVIIRNKIIIKDITYQEYKDIRDNIFLKDGYIMWSFDDIKYAIEQNKIYGGKVCKILINGNKFAIMYYKDKEKLIVKEAAIDNKYMKEILTFLAINENCTHIKAILSPNATIDGDIQAFGLCTMKYIKNGYINLVLD